MTPADNTERRSNLKAQLLERLHNPMQLRICVVTIVLLIGYVGIYMPLSEQIGKTTQKLNRDTKLLELAGTVEQLQEQYRKVETRVPQQTDSKEWMKYMLNAIRRLPVKLSKLDCRPPIGVGPLRGIPFQIELEGTFVELDMFLRWVESDKRFLRVNEVRMMPQHSSDVMFMQVTVIGLTG
jgi:Tfp pilus assembly protein PilO